MLRNGIKFGCYFISAYITSCLALLANYSFTESFCLTVVLIGLTTIGAKINNVE